MSQKENKPVFDRVTIIGPGLIGASLALALKRGKLAGHIVGCARSEATLEKALSLKIVDSATSDPCKAVENSDLVVLCTPVGTFAKIGQAIGPHIKEGAILSDVGSVKQSVIEDVQPFLKKGVHFIPAHPVAGTEHSGPEAGFAELFDGRWCVLTPPGEADKSATAKMKALWEALGAHVSVMDAAEHDQILAITSHLPHLIAYTIVDTATGLEKRLQSEVFKFAAGGFRDFTRIASSDPVMWRDIFLKNQKAVLEMLSHFSKDLAILETAIKDGDGETLEKIFRRTRAIRRGVIEAKQD